MSSQPPQHFYRFRTIEKLLGEKYQELESQEIYFASPAELNDPMEGFLEIFWQGDSLVWRNLFRNYLYCLERICLLLSLVGETKPLSAKEIPIFGNENQLPTEQAKEISRIICKTFFDAPVIQKYIERLSTRSKAIRRNELYSHLLNIHTFATEIILKEFARQGLRPEWNSPAPTSDLENMIARQIDSIDLTEQMEQKKQHIDTEIFFGMLRHMHDQMNLIGQANYPNLSEFNNRDFLLRDFPREYLCKLEELVYPEWYSACFMSDCTNASVWGHYGDKHQGVCLKFKSSLVNERPCLNLNCKIGWGNQGAISGIRNHPFHKVNYTNKHAEIDFFQSLGRLPMHDLMSFWYGSAQGEISKCAKKIIAPQNEEWREKYWEKFYQGVTTKTKDWQYENEYRLIVTNLFHDYSESSSRKFKYDFNDLDGIIFGIKTNQEDKIKIVKMIANKCKKENRKDFNFYQAFYSKEKACMDFSPMSLIKFFN